MSKTISAKEAKNRLGRWIDYVNEQNDEVVIERHGIPRAVIMSIDAFEEVQQLRERKRREQLRTQLRALRVEVSSRNTELTEDQVEAIASRFSREIIDDMATEGKIVFERDLHNEN